MLTCNRQEMVGEHKSGGGILWSIKRLMRERRLVRIVLVAAICLGVSGGVRLGLPIYIV